MKNKLLKKIGAALAACAIAVTAIASTAFAAGTEYSLIIHKYSNTPAGAPNGDGTVITDTSTFGTAMSGVKFKVYAASLEQDLTTYTEAVTVKFDNQDGNSPVDKTIYTKSTVEDTVTTNASGEATFSTYDAGLYYVEEVANSAVKTTCVPFAVYLPLTKTDGSTVMNDVNVYPKNEVDTVDVTKVVNKETVNNGDKVTWTISGDVNKDFYDSKDYKITDTLDSQLSYVPSSIKVSYTPYTTAGKGATNTPLTLTDDYTVDYTAPTVTVSLTQTGRQKVAAASLKNYNTENADYFVANEKPQVIVTFDTTVNITEANMGVDVTNEADISYTNKTTVIVTNTSNSEKVHNGGFKILKTNQDNVALAGVKFELYDADKTTKTKVDGTEIVLTTDAEGKTSQIGLAYGTYYLKEIKTNSGYNLPTEMIEITVDENSYEDVNRQTIINKKNTFILPVTGGMGTIIFTVIGGGLIVAAVILLVKTRKKAEN